MLRIVFSQECVLDKLLLTINDTFSSTTVGHRGCNNSYHITFFRFKRFSQPVTQSELLTYSVQKRYPFATSSPSIFLSTVSKLIGIC